MSAAATTCQCQCLLQTCTHVFVQHDAIRKPLQAPYDGTYEVLIRNKKHFTLNIKGHKEVVSMERLKPAFTDLTTFPESGSLPQLSSPTSTVLEPSFKLKSHHTITNSGRQVRWPAHLR